MGNEHILWDRMVLLATREVDVAATFNPASSNNSKDPPYILSPLRYMKQNVVLVEFVAEEGGKVMDKETILSPEGAPRRTIGC
jgi:hypothetical protein